MPFKTPEFTKNAKGGTELMSSRLESYLAANRPDLLEFFNFHVSRVVDYDETKPSVYIVHDLAEDPEAQHLANGGDKRFDLIVFVSNWQFQQYQERFKLDGSNCIVINNGIEPFSDLQFAVDKWADTSKIRLIYHTTPHRGLDILVGAFAQLWEEKWSKTGIDIELDVYSSFSIYGWEARDEPYQQMFDFCKQHPVINYHGAVSNEEVREALKRSHIFAYPSTWRETSCLALIEAMQSRTCVIHPNLGALIETGGDLTVQYPFKLDPQLHLFYFKRLLEREVDRIISKDLNYSTVSLPAIRSEEIHSWPKLARDWVNILDQIKEAVALATECA